MTRDAASGAFFVGSYTPSSGGSADGISIAEAEPDGTYRVRTLARLDDPSFLAVEGDLLYAVSETPDGSVHAYLRTGAGLDHRWSAPSGGDSPCHVRVDPSGAVVLTNYVSGTVTAVDPVTHASATAVLPPATGPVADRQDRPHAHQSVATPAGTVLVADLGGDALHELRITDVAAGPLVETVRVHHLAPGVGPRHMVWHDGDLIVAGELDGRVHRLRPDAQGDLVEVSSAAAFDGPVGDALLSHIEVDAASSTVYVAVRGRDTIAVFDARDGGLSLRAQVSSGGSWPRHFALTAIGLVVANQMSDALAVLPLDEHGIPGPASQHIPVGSPTCVVPVP